MKPGNILEGSRTPLSANDREVCARRAITMVLFCGSYKYY